MTDKFRIVDEYGTALEVTAEDGDFRVVTDADRLPQGHPVHLDAAQVEHLIISLAGLLPGKGE
jgi:hypothetical protein